MSSRTAGVGLRDEAGSSSANSRVKRAAVSSPLPEYFGNEENDEARATTHSNPARGLTARRSKPQPSASVGRCLSGSGTNSPAAIAASGAPTSNTKCAVFAGGQKVPDGKPQQASSKAPLAGTSSFIPAAAGGGGGGSRTARPRPRPRRQPLPPPSRSPRSGLDGSVKMSAVCWSKGGGSGGCAAAATTAAAVGGRGTSFSRAASRVALRAAQAKGLAVTLPAALCVPSRLMDSTAASRAGVYAPPSVGKGGSASAAAAAAAAAAGVGAGAAEAMPLRFATPRRRRSLGAGGVVAAVSGGGGAAATAAAPATPTSAAAAASTAAAVSASDGTRELAEPCDITSTSSGGSGSSGRKRELQERTGLVHVSDEVPPHSASGNNSFVPTVSSAIGLPKRGRSAGAALLLLPPTRCHDELSTELEAKAMRRSVDRSSRSSSSSSSSIINSAGGVALGGGGDDGRLWKPSRESRPKNFLDEAAEGGRRGTGVSGESLTAGSSAASFWSAEALHSRGGIGDAMVSSLDSSWSMASVDETARQPNARESHASGGDPVARMLLCQSDDYDYGLDFADSSSRDSLSSSSGSNSNSNGDNGNGGDGGDKNVSGGAGGVGFGPPSLATFARGQDGSSSSFSLSSSFSSPLIAGGGATGARLSPPGPETIPSLEVSHAGVAAAGGGGGGTSGGGGASREWGVGGRSSPTLFAACAAGGAAVKVSWVKRAEGGRGFGECRGGGVLSSVGREGFGDANGSENCLFRPFAFHRPG